MPSMGANGRASKRAEGSKDEDDGECAVGRSSTAATMPPPMSATGLQCDRLPRIRRIGGALPGFPSLPPSLIVDTMMPSVMTMNQPFESKNRSSVRMTNPTPIAAPTECSEHVSPHPRERVSVPGDDEGSGQMLLGRELDDRVDQEHHGPQTRRSVQSRRCRACGWRWLGSRGRQGR